jgi:hypothetical protein
MCSYLDLGKGFIATYPPKREQGAVSLLHPSTQEV